MHLKVYSWFGKDDYPRKFQYTWFKLFPLWLEYSLLKDVA